MRRIGWIAVMLVGLGFGMAARAQSDAMPPEIMADNHAHVASAPSMTLIVTVDGKATRLTAADLQAMPQKTIAIHNAHSNADETYTGVALSDLLAKYWGDCDWSRGEAGVPQLCSGRRDGPLLGGLLGERGGGRGA